MKKLLTSLLVFICFFSLAQNKPDSLQASIDSLFKSYNKPGSPGVAVLIVRDGKVAFEKGYGMANLEYGSQGSKNCETFATGGPARECIFHDITVGDNDVDCTGPYNCFDPNANEGVPGVLSISDSSYQPAFKAGVGWDFATGLGSVNATNLVLNPIWLLGALP